MAALHRRTLPGSSGATSAGLGPVPFGVLLALTAAGPFLLGGGAGLPAEGMVRSLGTSAYAVLAFLVAVSTLLSGAPSPRRRRLLAPAGAMSVLVLLGLLQLLPLPERFLRAIAPVNVTIYHETAELLGLFGAAAGPPARVSIAPRETAAAVLALAAATALVAAAALLVATRSRRRALAGVLLGVAALELALSAWRAEPGAFRGGFPDRDAFAAFLQVALAAGFAVVWTEVLTGRERAIDAVGLEDRVERRFPALALRLLLWAAPAAGIVLSGSRAGMLGAATATVGPAAMGLLRRRGFRPGRVAAVAGALLAVLLVLAGSGLLDRPLGRAGAASRSTRDATLAAWKEFRIVGSGLGTFREAFRRVQPPDLAAPVDRPESDALDLAVTGGIAGAAGGVLLAAACLTSLSLAWARQRHRAESATTLAAWGAVAGLAVHAVAGTGVGIPVTGWTLAIFFGAALGASARA